MEKNSILKQYVGVVQRVARIEHKRMPRHMIEYEELVSIGIIAVQSMIKNKTQEQLANYNDAYMGTAIKWAIRNELRHRFKWYSIKNKKSEDDAVPVDSMGEDGSSEDSTEFNISPGKVREAVYETILSIEGLAAAASDNASPFDFLKDPSAMPDEKAEIVEMSRLIKQAIAKLPPKERTVVEYRFYRNMQVKDIAKQVGLSSSRVTRIVQASLNTVKEYLNARDLHGY